MDGKLPLLVAIVSLLLQIAGFVSPGWLRFSDIDMGLWYYCKSGTCALYQSIDDDSFHAHSTFWRQCQIHTSIGLAAGIIALCVTFAFFRGKCSNPRSLMLMSCLDFLISGVAAWLSAGNVFNMYLIIPVDGILDVPYAVILTAIGASLALCNVIIILVLRYKTPAQPTGTIRQSSLSTGHPMQTEAQTNSPNAFYPSQGATHQGQVQNQLHTHNQENVHQQEY